MKNFIFNTAGSIVYETGASKRIAEIVKNKIGSKVLFITDAGLRGLGLCNSAISSLENAGYEVSVFDEVEADPSYQTLMNAVKYGEEHNVDGVIGFGGGSPLDVAKLAALLLGSKEDLNEAWGVGLAKGPRLPLVLLPTTAGTGSEVTPVAIITVGEEEKKGVNSPLILPDIAILDPELTVGLPPAITAATGIDAMVHAIEAYTSTSANNNPISRNLACNALSLLADNIHEAVNNGTNLEARGNMLLGSMLAGQAFANSPVAAVHALAYPLGGIFHVPHGLSNALVLPHVMKFNAPEAAVQYAGLAHFAFPELLELNDPEGATEGFVQKLADLSKDFGLPTTLREVGVQETDLRKLASEAMKQTRLLVNNPVEVREEDAFAIYSEAF